MTNLPQFAEGELVDVTIRGARFSGAEPHLGMHGFDLAGKDRRIWLPLDIPGVTVERVAPTEWPPQLGDIWADRDGIEWAAGVTDGETIVMWRIGDNGAGADALDVLYDHGPVTLLRRRGWTQATDTTPTAPEQVDERAVTRTEALADLAALLDRPGVPEPAMYFQAGFTRGTPDEQLAEFRRAAALLSMEIHEYESDSKHRYSAAMSLGAGVTYALFLSLPISDAAVELTDAQLDAAETLGEEPPADCDCEDCDPCMSLDEALADAEALGLLDGQVTA